MTPLCNAVQRKNRHRRLSGLPTGADAVISCPAYPDNPAFSGARNPADLRPEHSRKGLLLNARRGKGSSLMLLSGLFMLPSFSLPRRPGFCAGAPVSGNRRWSAGTLNGTDYNTGMAGTAGQCGPGVSPPTWGRQGGSVVVTPRHGQAGNQCPVV